MKPITVVSALALALAAAPLAAQDAGEPGVTAESGEAAEENVFAGDYLTVGIGLAYGASYSGSDDYTSFVLPIVQGSLGGIGISPRPAGVALDFINDASDAPITFTAGPSVKLNRDRVKIEDIKDPIVQAYGELDTAIEVGPNVGIGIRRVLHGYDSLTFGVDAAWDVAGAHDGMTISPSATYFTPLSRGIAASFSLSATYVDDDYADYYYSVAPINTLLPASDVLPGFQADGGFEKLGANLLVGIDLNGNVADGGLSLVALGGYSRLVGDAADSPFTSIRGDADQFLIAGGIGYTF